MNVLIQCLVVGAGGALGAILRYLGFLAWRRFGIWPYVPLATMAVNLIGCLLIGWLTGLVIARDVIHPLWRLFLIAGLLGGLTTFSTFGMETVLLARDQSAAMALVYAAIQVVLGIGLAWVGFQIHGSSP